MATPPTVRTGVASAWNTTTSPKSISVSPATNDYLVSLSANEGTNTAVVPSGGGLTWTQRNREPGGANSSEADAYTSTQVTSGGAVSISETCGAGVDFGGIVFPISGSDGYDTSGGSQITSGTTKPSTTVTTTTDNCAILAICVDWNAGTATATWDAIGSQAATSVVATQVAGRYTIYVGYWADVSTAGAKTVAMTGSQRWSLAAVAMKGTAAGGSNLTDTENDTAGLTDTLTVAEQFTDARTDSVGITDVQTIAQQHNQAIVNDLSITDSFTISLDSWNQQIENPVNITDQFNAMMQFAFAQSDPLNITDTATVAQTHNFTTTDTVGLIDSLSFSTVFQPIDLLNLTDQVTAAILFMNGYIDLLSLTDSVTVNLVNNGSLSIVDALGLTDSLSISGVTDANQSNLSIVDQIMLWLGSLGYTGTIQDRQYYYLRDRYVATFGQPAVSLTQGDLQYFLSGHVREVLRQADYV